MKKIAIVMCSVGLTLLFGGGSVSGKTLYSKCKMCHGAKGQLRGQGVSAVIQGQPEAVTIKQLKGYRAGILNQYGRGNVMHNMVKNFNDKEIRSLAHYIAGMK